MEDNEHMIVRPEVRAASKSPPIHDRKSFILAALDEYEQGLTRYAQRMLGNNKDLGQARDIVQHTFLKLCEQNISDIADRIGPWLFQVCRNKIIDQFRSQGRQAETWPEPFQIEDTSPGPAEKVEYADLLRSLSVLIGKLPGAEREIVELWSQGFNHSEVSEILTKSRESIRMGLSRGLKKLRQNPEVKVWLERATGSTHSDFPKGPSKALPAQRQSQSKTKPR